MIGLMMLALVAALGGTDPGEEPYDAARRREIDTALHGTRGGAKRATAPLRRKYAKNPPVLDRVNLIQTLMESAF